MDDEIRRRLLRAVIGEERAGAAAFGAGRCPKPPNAPAWFPSQTRRALQELREHDPPLVWGDVDANTGEELWWLLSSGLNELVPPRRARA